MDGIGDAELEKFGEGVLGVLGSASHDTLEGIAAGVVLVDDAVFCLCVNLGMGFVALDFSSKGVLDSEASAPAVRLETNVLVEQKVVAKPGSH
jgi:hypothetical protein